MAIASLNNEEELIFKISKGDKRAFAVLFDGYYKTLAAYILKLTESIEITEEIVQDIFIKIWINRENLENINNFSNYIFILSKNQTLNYLRKKANDQIKLKAWERELEGEVLAKDDHDAIELFRLLIDQAIDKLPAQQKKIYQLSRQERLKYDEIAKKLKISFETVKKHIYLATKAIKVYVSNHMDDVVLMILLSQIVFF